MSTLVSEPRWQIAEDDALGLIHTVRQRVHPWTPQRVSSGSGWQGFPPEKILMVCWRRDRECSKANTRNLEHHTFHDGISPEVHDQIRLERLENASSDETVARMRRA